MMRAAIAAALALAGTGGPCLADDEKDRNDGNAILEMCSAVERYTEGNGRNSAKENVNFFECLSYMDGSLDMLRWSLAASGEIFPICMPDQVTRGQSARIVVAWLRNHPDKLHLSGSLLIPAALMEAFPCETAPKPKPKESSKESF